MGKIIDFDATGETATRNFFRTFFEHSRDKNQVKNEEFMRSFRRYLSEKDMAGRDPNLSNLTIPKVYSTVETIVPHFIDALLGVRPYIPIELTRDKNSDASNAMTDLLDTFLDDANFYWEAVKLIKYVTLFGTGFIEARPDYEMRKIVRDVPQFGVGLNGEQILVGVESVSEVRKLLKLQIRAFAPWEIYQDEYAKTVDQSRGIIKFRGMMSKRQIKKMADRGAFPEFDFGKLEKENNTSSEFAADHWSETMYQSIGVPVPKTDDDMGIWLSYESEDRYIDMWNFNLILRDNGNPYSVQNGGHGKINLTKVINTDSPNPETSWYGLGEAKPIERLCVALDKHWNQTFDNHDMQNEGVIYYAEDAFDVDQLMMIGGNRIAAEIGPGQKIGDVLQERATPGLPRDFYAIPGTLGDMIDESSGIHEITRGQTQVREQTAREAILKRGAGDSRIKLKIRMAERMGLGDFGIKCLHHLDQFGTPDDYVEKIGVEQVQYLPTVNPALYDGGYQFAFKGSSRMADAQIQRQDAKDIFQLMRDWTAISQKWLGNYTLDKFEVPESERRLALRSDEEALALQQAQEAGVGGAETTRGVSNGASIGAALGQTPAGRDQNEKLGAV